jgi:hypothetical protein
MIPAVAAPRASAPVSAPAGRLRWTTVALGAVVVTLVRPAAWAVGLAGLLAGGGLLLLGAPIVVLPTPTGIQNALGAPVSTLVVGTPSASMIALIAGSTLSVFVLAAAGLLAGAWAERAGIGITLEAAHDEALLDPPPDFTGAPGTWRVAGVRLLGLLPVLAIAIVAWQPIYDAAYHELVLPDDLASPLVIRVIRDAPWTIAALVLVFLASDAAAALGVRRLVLGRRPVLVAWLLGWADLVHRPVRTLGTAAFGLGVLVLLAGPAILAVAAGWGRVRDAMIHGSDPVATLATVVLWVAIWLGGLVLAGVGNAIRAAAWTLEATPTTSR